MKRKGPPKRKGREAQEREGGKDRPGKGAPVPSGLGRLKGFERVASVPARVSVYRRKGRE